MTSVHLSNVSVEIPIYNAGSRSLKSNVIAAATGGKIKSSDNKRVSIQAIDDLTLHFDHGSRVGLIGHNGAGKSTLLRVIARIYEPTAGRVDVEGEVATMFDIGFGMDPEATGLQNIVSRGMILGMGRKRIEQQVAAIGQATGLGDFLEMPLRTYSSGMATRLAFAISTSITPDILLIDEGIGAGDAAFMSEAKVRLRDFIESAGILVMASHSSDLLRAWCNIGVWMEHGRLRMMGDLEDVLAAYALSVASHQ